MLSDNGNGNQFKSDFALGVNYAISHYYIGLAFNHLTEAQFDDGSGLIQGGLDNHFNLIGGADFRLSDKIDISPSFIFRSDWNTLSWQFSATGTYEGKYTLGSSVRNSNNTDDIMFIAGANLSRDGRLKLSYALDYVLSGRAAKAGSSHEMVLIWKLPMPKKAEKRIIRNPQISFLSNEARTFALCLPKCLPEIFFEQTGLWDSCTCFDKNVVCEIIIKNESGYSIEISSKILLHLR